MSKPSDHDNRANQMNPNNDAYWQSRGFEGRPDDWEHRVESPDNPCVGPKTVNRPVVHSRT